MRKTSLILGIVFIISIGNVSCQPNGIFFTLSEEVIEIKNSKLDSLSLNKRLDVVGNAKSNVVILGTNEDLYIYDESKEIIKPFIEVLTNNNSKAIRMLVQDDLLFQVGFFSLPNQYKNIPIDEIPIDQFEYQDFWLQYKGENIKIDSFPYHFLDKYVSCKFSDDGRQLICNPYTTVSAGYSTDIDDRIYLYNLQSIENGKIEKQIIHCDRCFNTHIINNTFYFGKEIPIGRGYDGYYDNIYKAPVENINDTIQIAHDIKIVATTPDGKYILGTKYLYGKATLVIINVEIKKYQYILGRDYPLDNMFYSFKEGKFAFVFGKHIVYIIFPNEFPFNALDNISFKQTSKAENEAFWKKYRHRPLQ